MNESDPTSVLIIESHPLMREALQTVIVSEPGLELAVPTLVSRQPAPIDDSELAGTILLAFKPDIVLMAIGNPGLDELQALKVLHQCLPHTPILALTSSEVDGQDQAAQEAGASTTITKAASLQDLTRALHELRTVGRTTHPENLQEVAQGPSLLRPIQPSQNI